MARHSLPVIAGALALLLSAVIELDVDARAFVHPQSPRLRAMPAGICGTASACHAHQPCSGLTRMLLRSSMSCQRHRRLSGVAMSVAPAAGDGASSSTDAGGGMQWRFWRHSQWHRYGEPASLILENAIAAGEEFVTLTLNTTSTSSSPGDGTCEYIVSLDTSTKEFLETGDFSQRNKLSGHVRAVRRAPSATFHRSTVPELFEAPPLEPLAAEALRTNAPIMLRGNTFSLREELTVGTNGFVLKIRGPGKIVGDAHTLFKVGGNRAMLDAENVEFVHVASELRKERRELGAAVFVLGKARASLVNCSLTSEQGFGLWLSQQARVRAEGCRIDGCGRSAVVLFGHGSLLLDASNISAAGMHGICARGNTQVVATGCCVREAATRGIFAYENATLHLKSCLVAGTRDAGLAAVQVESLQPGDCATLHMDETCRFEANLGVDLHVAGAVNTSEAVEHVYGVRAVDTALGVQRGKSWAAAF